MMTKDLNNAALLLGTMLFFACSSKMETADYTQYHYRIDGLCGYDDFGNLSAWYFFPVMGFYPVNPCIGEYIPGALQMPEVAANLPNAEIFPVVTENLSDKNIYVPSIELNG